jgi:hypothetical protein
MSAVNAIPMIRSNNDNTGNPFRTSSASTTSRCENGGSQSTVAACLLCCNRIRG